MFITVKDYFDKSEHCINSNNIVQLKKEDDEKYSVIELNDYDGTFVRIDKDTYVNIKRTLERMG